jgi:predicted aldo/keto reductase-like oxidoreductase
MKPMNNNRRAFLKTALSSMAGAAVLPSVLTESARAETEEKEQKEWKIIQRKLGNTGITVPIVSSGAKWGSPDLLRAALDAGVTHIDTANSYGRGRNEELVGEVIKDRPRDSYVLATKVAPSGVDRKTGLCTKESTVEPFLEKFEESMTRLGVEYVDILYLHSTVTGQATLWEPYLNAMVKLKKEGRIRHIGVSTHSNEPEVIRAATESGVYEVVLTAYNFRQPHVAEVEKAMAEAAKAGLGIVAMKTQAGVYWDKERENQINMKAALKWALKNENVHTSIPGFSSYEQFEVDMSVMENLALTPEEKKDLEQGDEMGKNGLFCDQCRECLAQCPKGVDVPTLLRSYMYTYGYRDLAAAKLALETVDVADAASACGSCETCSVRCTMGFDVRGRVCDVARIRHVPDDFVV